MLLPIIWTVSKRRFKWGVTCFPLAKRKIIFKLASIPPYLELWTGTLSGEATLSFLLNGGLLLKERICHSPKCQFFSTQWTLIWKGCIVHGSKKGVTKTVPLLDNGRNTWRRTHTCTSCTALLSGWSKSSCLHKPKNTSIPKVACSFHLYAKMSLAVEFLYTNSRRVL